MNAINRLKKEFDAYEKNPLEDFIVTRHENYYLTVFVTFKFKNIPVKIEIQYSAKHPFYPPKVIFKSGISHVSRVNHIKHRNVNEDGELIIDELGVLWSPAIRIEYLLMLILSVLQEPQLCSFDSYEAFLDFNSIKYHLKTYKN